MEDRKTLATVTVTLFSLVAIMGVTTYFARQSPGITTSGRFTAREGTTREGARILTSAQRPASGAPPPPPSSTATPDPLPIVSLSGETTAEKPRPKPALVTAAQAAAAAGDLDKVEDLLKSATTADDRALVHLELARVYDGLPPGMQEHAEEALAAAAAEPASPEVRKLVALEQARRLLHQEKWPEAAALLDAADETESSDSSAELELHVLQGQAREGQGMTSEAQREYEAAIAMAGRLEALPDRTKDAVRLAGLRLIRLLRATGQEEALAVHEQHLKALLRE